MRSQDIGGGTLKGGSWYIQFFPAISSDDLFPKCKMGLGRRQCISVTTRNFKKATWVAMFLIDLLEGGKQGARRGRVFRGTRIANQGEMIIHYIYSFLVVIYVITAILLKFVEATAMTVSMTSWVVLFCIHHASVRSGSVWQGYHKCVCITNNKAWICQMYYWDFFKFYYYHILVKKSIS